ncbi:MAG: acyl-CoA carboxylase biotin carboxyl carrier protein subunit [Planctomycetota bacterium]
MKYYARVGDKEYECTLEAENGQVFVIVQGQRYRADLRHIPRSHAYSLLLDGKSYEFALHEADEEIELSGGAGLFHVQVEDARTHAARAKTAGVREIGGVHTIRAVMPGIVREVRVRPGAVVAKGDALLILEAMKMQNEIRADHAGTVKQVHIAVEETVDKGARLVDIE